MSLQEGVWSSWEMIPGKIFFLELSHKLSSSHPSMSETYIQWTMASWNTSTQPVSTGPDAVLGPGEGYFSPQILSFPWVRWLGLVSLDLGASEPGWV